MAFCVGLELYIAKTRLAIYATYLIVFSIMSPIGIGIGIAITISSNNEIAYYLSVAILQALAGGTILYVVVFEVLERERSKSVSGIAQLMFVIIGFCCMMSVELLGMKKFCTVVDSFFIWCQSGIIRPLSTYENIFYEE